MASKYERAVRVIRHRVRELEAAANREARELVRDFDDGIDRRFEAVKVVAHYEEAKSLLDLVEAVGTMKRPKET